MKKFFLFICLSLYLFCCSNNRGEKTLLESKEDITIDFQLEQGRIVLYAKINDMDSLRFMLDNGATATVFDSDFWSSFENTSESHIIKESSRLSTYFCPTSIALSKYIYSIDTVYIASKDYSDNHFSSLSLNGMIGVELFYKKVVSIDFEHHKIHISDQLPENIQNYKKYDMISSYKHDNPYYSKFRFLSVDGLFNKKGEPVTSNFLIDLGCVTNNIDCPFCDNIDIKKSKEMSKDTNSIIYALINKYPMIETVYMDATSDTMHIDHFKSGVIGIDFLKHFNVIFDYPHNKLYLKPIKQ